ncbi:MAG: hypothetical protein JRI80_10155 [Deltaproteobacteria bacterium]|nr:hypothetical protein [Deltaproteobacteria bacterium]
MDTPDLQELDKLIKELEKTANALIKKARGIQAIERNADRILASTKMLKLNVCDLILE